jgi:ABC-2 type transport system permease protein
LLIGLLFLAIGICLQSIAFFTAGGSALADQLFETMICLGTIPQHTNGLVVKVILFTILPAGFMAIMPVEIVHRHSLALLAVLALAVSAYLAISVAIFNRGVSRYTSATGRSA